MQIHCCHNLYRDQTAFHKVWLFTFSFRLVLCQDSTHLSISPENTEELFSVQSYRSCLKITGPWHNLCPQKKFIYNIYIYIRGFFWRGFVCFVFLFWGFFCSDCVKTLWPFPSLMYVLVRMFCHLSMMIYRSSFFIKQILHYIRISHYFTRPSHSFFALKLNIEYLQMSFVRT